jgi:hypothetical protein
MFSGGARDISIAVRDGLLLLEQQQAVRPETLIEEQEANTSLRGVQNLIDSMARQERLWLANGMQAALLAGTVPEGGTFSLARWAEIQEAFAALKTWMATPLAVCGMPPIVVVSRRGNPVEPVTPDPEPEPEETIEEPAQ